MSLKKDKLETNFEASIMVWDIYLKAILFGVSILILIALSVTFIYLAVQSYDPILVVAVGASDGLFGIVIFHITKSLFKAK